MTKALEAIERQYPEAAKVIRAGEEDVLTYYTFPQAHWRQIRSTNPLERLNREQKHSRHGVRHDLFLDDPSHDATAIE